MNISVTSGLQSAAEKNIHISFIFGFLILERGSTFNEL
jgi:hypothetical protein